MSDTTADPKLRTPKEIMKAHGRALIKGDLDAVVANYAEDAIFITPRGVKRGRDGVREAQTQTLAELANARYTYRTNLIEDDVMFLEWSAEGPDFTVDDGVDTLVFAAGHIRVQTLTYTIRPKA